MVKKAKMILPAVVVATSGMATSASVQGTPVDSLGHPEDSTEVPVNVDRYAKYRDAEKQAIALISFMENCEFESYFCSVRWTIAFGNTVRPDGSRVQKGDVITDKAQAVEYLKRHLENYVYPQMDLIKREMTPHQQAALISLLYNVNPVYVTGVDDSGVRKREPSVLVKKLNGGASDESCADAFMEFCYAKQQEYPGLVKRRAFEAGFFLGWYRHNDLMNFSVNGIGSLNADRLTRRKVSGDNKMERSPRQKRILKKDEATRNYLIATCSKPIPDRKNPGKMMPKVVEMLKDFNLPTYFRAFEDELFCVKKDLLRPLLNVSVKCPKPDPKILLQMMVKGKTR